MITTMGSTITSRVIQLLMSTSGVNAYLAGLVAVGTNLAPLQSGQVRAQNIAPEIADRSSTMQYPTINVYCEKIVNDLTEKFRTFSGSVQVTVEVRHSQDRLEGLQDGLENYAEAVMQVLNDNRGDWGGGLFYGGKYQAVFGAVKHAGRNFMQVAKIVFEIGVSRS